MRRLRASLADLGLVLLALAVLAGCVWLVTTQPGGVDDAAAAPAPAPRVVMITAELAVAPPDGRSAAETAAAELGLELELVDARGSGFAAAVDGAPNLSGVVEARLEGEPDVVVVQGGRRDAAMSIGTVASAAAGLIDRIRQRVPLQTRLVLIGPVAGGDDPGGIAAVREAMRSVAARKRVHFLDPVAASWVQPPAGAGPVTPQQREQLAARLAQALRELGIAAA